MRDLLAVKEAAEVLTVSPRTVYRLIAEGELRVVPVRGSTRIRQSELDAYLRRRERVA